MKIAVVGAGAMGSLFGAMLAEAGNEVWLCDLWPEHVQAINNQGLLIESQRKRRHVSLRATVDPASIGPAELVIIFVKSTHTKIAAETARFLVGIDGAVLTLQNGMGNAEAIEEHIATDRILVGTTAHGATMLGPGNIRHAGGGPTTLGPWQDTEQAGQLAERIADVFNTAGIDTEAVKDVRHVIWDKLLINIGINAITALTAIKNGQILDLESTKALCRTAVEEAMAVARARNIPVREDAVNVVFKVAEATSVNRSSMGQDVDNKRPTEIGAINGFIMRESEKLGLDAPVNSTLTALIETLQYHY